MNNATFPNKKYMCCVCGKKLGDRYSRLKGNKNPNATFVEGKEYCDKCFLKIMSERFMKKSIDK